MARVNITKTAALKAIIAHLKSDLSLEEHRAFYSIAPVSVRVPQGSDWWLSVSGNDGEFDQELLTGAVIEQCTENSSFTLTAYKRLHYDETDHHDELVLRAGEGLEDLAKLILKSLAGVDLQSEGNEFSRELFSPQSISAPDVLYPEGEDEDEKIGIGFISVTFGLSFDWDLS